MQTEITKRVSAAKELFANPLSFPVENIGIFSEQVLIALRSGKKIAFVGNGGSAAEAMHLAAEFTGKCVIAHVPLAAICLNESQSALTAIANDYGVDHIFSRQVEAHLREGDILVALSTSGKSPNIINALSKAIEIGVKSFLWTGDSKIEMENLNVWNVPSGSTPRVQEIHLAWGHILAEIIELQL